MTIDQLTVFALLAPALLGALYLSYQYYLSHRPATVGAVVGGISGGAGALLFLVPLDFCTFAAETSYEDHIFGLILAGAGAVIAIGFVQWLSQTLLGGRKLLLGGGHSAGMFRGWLTPWLLLFPSLVILVLFLYYPALQTFRLSVTNARLGRAERFICVDNFTRLMDGDGFRWEIGAILAVILGAAIALRWLRRDNWFGILLRELSFAVLVYFLFSNLNLILVFVIGRLVAFYLSSQDRDTMYRWLGYGVLAMLAVLFMQEVLAEVLSRSYYKVIVNTAYIAFFVVVVTLILSLIVAYVAYQPIKGANIYRTLLIWPYAISPAVAGIIFGLMFHPQSGLVNHLIESVGLQSVDWKSPQMAPWTIIMASVWKSMGFSILFYIAGLQNIPKDLLEAGSIDGANAWQRFTRITVPMLSPITFFLIITNITYAFFDIFGTIDYLTQGGPAGATTVMIYDIYYGFSFDNYLGRAASQSIILFLLVIGITFLQFRTTGRRVTYGA